MSLGFPEHPTNGDDARHNPAWVSYSKGLPHAVGGEADEAAVAAYLVAIRSGDAKAFERVPMAGYLKLANPQAAFAFDLIGPDGHQLPIEPPPSFGSASQASEAVELYWKALARDVPFAAYGEHPLIRSACEELTRQTDFAGPKVGRSVNAATVFRGGLPGGLIGPYISQFLYRDVPWTPIRVPQRIRIAAARKDYLTTAEDWLAMQNGAVFGVNDYEDVPRYIRTGRDLAEYVHRDFTYQAFLGACLILFRLSAPIDGGIPYHHSVSQSGFVTFGPSDILHLVAVVANVALKAAWYHKWCVHRRLRPEEYAARVDAHVSGRGAYPLHADVLNASAVERVARLHGARFLPQSYPEGAPLHPSFPSGHAVIAGACATALKACFTESFVLPASVVPSDDGLALMPYTTTPLTVGGELDKLAENVSFGRNFAGIHWRSDATDGLALGEAVAIEVLRQMRTTSAESFAGYALTKFNGERVTV
ncbi:MAG: vanadium-dependent haloperoxidase [Acidobacteriota bacterium]|nr:vanadium-dependent haloperoxidase [Acidobacteriota bacterium]